MSSDTHTVTVDVGARTVPLEHLVQKYERGERLHKEEINVLAEYPRTGVDVAEWRRLNAKLLFGSNPHVEGDAAAEQAATEWLRELFEEHGVESVADYHDLLGEVSEDHPVQEAVKKLTENATPFKVKPGAGALLGDRGEKSAEELYRPADAGDDWDPATDQGLHEFIALMESTVGEDPPEEEEFETDTWAELKEAAQFDPEEWGLDASPDAGER